MSDAYLENVYRAFNGGAPATSSTTVLGPAPAPMFGLPGGPPVVVKAPVEAPPPPAPDPHASEELQMSVAGPNASAAPPPAPPPAAPAGPPPAPNVGAAVAPPLGEGPYQFPLKVVPGGGVIPAHELERRGPSLLGAQGARNEASAQTIENVRQRNEDMATQEQAMYLDHERQARAREAAVQQSFAERDEELAQRQADFDSTVKQLGKLGTIDRDRFWASRTTGQKIAGIIELAASGFNRAPSLLMKRIDDDVKAQEFAFYATRDTAQAKQTAFAQAMQKYQNADAARAAARAAAVDTVQAQFAQMSAKWKGTEAANRADMASAALQDEKMMQIANGVQFIPAQSVGRRFYDPRSGLIYSETDARKVMEKVDERNAAAAMKVAEVGGNLAVADVNAEKELRKEQLKAQKDQGELVVEPITVGAGPDGTPLQLGSYTAKTVEEAKDARAGRRAGVELLSAIDKALKLREEAGVSGRLLDAANPTSTERYSELEGLGPQIGVAWSKTKKLGTYDAGVERLIQGIQGNPTAVGKSADVKLRQLRSMVLKGLGAEEEAQGGSTSAMPGSFKGHKK